MASPLLRLVINDVVKIQSPLIRHGRHMRGKPPGEARSLKQRLEELNYKDPELTYRVNIGFAQAKRSRSLELKERIECLRQFSKEHDLEKLSRLRKLEVPLESVKEEWCRTVAPFQLKAIADHYGIYEHLFGNAYFMPRIMLDITYPQNDGNVSPVYRGNIIKPFEAAAVPDVKYDASNESLWTLILSNPDGHFTDDNAEYIHWFVGNIPGNNIKKGEVVWDYLQPFPPRGTGFHRFVFILYRQHAKMDYSQLKKSTPCLTLSQRTFKTLDFYKERQEKLTPAGLAFFQSDWDPSLTDFYHNKLNMTEPVFEYDFPKTYVRPQEWFPLKKSFNLYMDRYREPKQIAKEYFLKKLKKSHPFKKPEPQFKYPNTIPFKKYSPSWLRLEITKDRLSWGRINDF